jgi:hypothetical protein
MREMGVETGRTTTSTPRTWGANPRFPNSRFTARDPNAMDIDATNTGTFPPRTTSKFGLVETRQCFGCGKAGHLNKTCPERLCRNCGQKGHSWYECPTCQPRQAPRGAQVRATTGVDGNAAAGGPKGGDGDKLSALQQQLDTMAEGMASLMDTIELKKKEDF